MSAGGGVEGMGEETKWGRSQAVGSRHLSIALGLLASRHGNDGSVCGERRRRELKVRRKVEV